VFVRGGGGGGAPRHNATGNEVFLVSLVAFVSPVLICHSPCIVIVFFVFLLPAFHSRWNFYFLFLVFGHFSGKLIRQSGGSQRSAIIIINYNNNLSLPPSFCTR